MESRRFSFLNLKLNWFSKGLSYKCLQKGFFFFYQHKKAVELSFLSPQPGLKKKRFPAEECLGGGTASPTAVSSYSPTDQQAGGGD